VPASLHLIQRARMYPPQVLATIRAARYRCVIEPYTAERFFTLSPVFSRLPPKACHPNCGSLTMQVATFHVSAITSGGSHRSCSRIGFHPSDLLGLLGIDGIHADRRDCRGYGADPSFLPALYSIWFGVRPTAVPSDEQCRLLCTPRPGDRRSRRRSCCGHNGPVRPTDFGGSQNSDGS
jgi:hypothetical protein